MTTPTQPSAAAMAAAEEIERDPQAFPIRPRALRIIDRARIIDTAFAPVVEALRDAHAALVMWETQSGDVPSTVNMYASDEAAAALAAATGTEEP